MPDVERFGDVDGGIVDAHRLPLSVLARTVLSARGEHRLERLLRPQRAVDLEIDVPVHRRNLANDFVRLVIRGDLLGDERGRLAHRLGELEAGQREIPHLRVRGEFDHRIDIVFRKPLRLYAGGDVSLKIHTDLFPFEIPYKCTIKSGF